MPKLVDYSWSRPDPADLVRRGVSGVMRYLGNTTRDLGAAELVAMTTIGAADALYLGLADYWIDDDLPPLIEATPGAQLKAAIAAQALPAGETPLAAQRERVLHHFARDSVADIMASLDADGDPFAQAAL